MSKMTLTVNGRPHDVDVDPATPLLYVLSDDLQQRADRNAAALPHRHAFEEDRHLRQEDRLDHELHRVA